MSHAVGAMRELHLGRVLSNDDPESRGRIEVEMSSTGLVLWASCITNSAGPGYGISALPRIDEIVVIAFIGPDENNAFVLGSVWNGGDSHPSEVETVEDTYAIRTPAGAQIKIDDQNGPQIAVETPSGAHVTIDDSAGSITLETGSDTIEIKGGEIKLTGSSKVKIDATTVEVSATQFKVQAGMADFSGAVMCTSLTAKVSVSSPSYTPGAGNML